MSRKGTITSAGSSPSATGSAMRGGMGDANVTPGALTTGKTEDGQRVGRTDAVTVELPLSSTKTEYQVIHNLGRVPGFVKLVGVRNDTSRLTTVVIAWLDRDRWTDTTASVYVNLLSGSLSNAILTLEVGGGR